MKLEFSTDRKCVKCSAGSIETEYMDSNELRRECRECGYSWHEMPADSLMTISVEEFTRMKRLIPTASSLSRAPVGELGEIPPYGLTGVSATVAGQK